MIIKTLATLLLALSILPLQFTPDTAPRCPGESGNPYDGYLWSANHSICVPGFVTIKTWYTPAPPYVQGNAVWYAPRLMESTAAYRELSLDGYVDGVSLMSPSDIGRTVWLRRPDHDWEGPFLVVDCARRGDIWPVVMMHGEIVEVGFQTAARWGMVDATLYGDIYDRPYKPVNWRIEGVEVLKMDAIPPWIGKHTPLDFVEWWGERYTFSNSRAHDTTKPVSINPKYYPDEYPGWIWRGEAEEIMVGAYGDWFSILYGDDPRFEFDLPNNYESHSYYWRCIIDDKCSPGFRQIISMEEIE